MARGVCAFRDLAHCQNPSVGLVSQLPTVIRSGGFSVRILLPPREHGPPHVHVVRGGAEVVIRLGATGESVKLVEVHGMKASNVVRAVRLVGIWKDDLLATWEAIHGE